MTKASPLDLFLHWALKGAPSSHVLSWTLQHPGAHPAHLKTYPLLIFCISQRALRGSGALESSWRQDTCRSCSPWAVPFPFC